MSVRDIRPHPLPPYPYPGKGTTEPSQSRIKAIYLREYFQKRQCLTFQTTRVCSIAISELSNEI